MFSGLSRDRTEGRCEQLNQLDRKADHDFVEARAHRRERVRELQEEIKARKGKY